MVAERVEQVAGQVAEPVGQLEDVRPEGVVREQLGLCCQQWAFWGFD